MLIPPCNKFYLYYLIFVLEFDKTCFDHIWPLPQLFPYSHPPFLITQRCVPFSLIMANVCYRVVLLWSTVNPPRAILLGETDPSSPSHQQLPITPQLGAEMHAQLPLPSRDLVWLGLAQFLYMFSHLLWVHMRSSYLPVGLNSLFLNMKI